MLEFVVALMSGCHPLLEGSGHVVEDWRVAAGDWPAQLTRDAKAVEIEAAGGPRVARAGATGAKVGRVLNLQHLQRVGRLEAVAQRLLDESVG